MSKRQEELFPDLPSDKKYVSDYPELVAEWHPTKNGNKSPEDVLHGSNKLAWWQCGEGHEWEAAVFNRAIHAKNCPYCARRKVSDTNNLLYRFPEIAKFWSGKNDKAPHEVVAKSGKKYLWVCAAGHEWESSPHNLVKKKFSCPLCAHDGLSDAYRKASEAYNLTTEFPELASQWGEQNQRPPTYYMPKSNDKVWWRCAKGHEWKATIDSRSRGNGCPYCACKKPSPEYNFAALYPDLLAEWDFRKNSKPPDQFLPQSNKPVWWCCERGHEWEAPIYRRTTNGSGCPSCSNQTSKNELRIFTELAAVFDNVHHRQKLAGFEVDVYLPDFCVAVEYDGKYWHREKGEQDQAKHEHLAALGVTLIRIREAPLTKLQDHDIILPMGSFITKAKMDEVVVRLDAVSPYLSEQNFWAEETYLTYLDYFPSPFPEHSLATVNPALALEWHPTKNSPLTPRNFTQSAKPKVWWQCSEGHEWKAAIYSRNLGGHACPYCAGRKATKKDNMAVTHPWMAALFHPTKNEDFTPQNLKAGTGRLVYWQCHCGYEWQQTGDKLSRLTIEPCRRCRSLATKRPDIAAMWHPTLNGNVTPTDVTFSSGINRWWRCLNDEKHTWQASPNNMTAKNRKTLCPHCK